MRSLRRWRVSLPLLMLFGNGNEGLLGKTGMVVGVQAADVVGVPEAMITPAPQRVEDSVEARLVRLRQEQEGDPNAIQLLEILATALPQSLRQIAATNIPAVSSILWSEFLDNNRPQWFNELPYDIQSYLIREFGPVTAAPPETATGALPSDVTASVTGSPTSISQSQATSTATSSVQESQSTALGLQSSSRTTLTASSSSQSASSTSRQSSLLTTSASLTTLSTLTTPLTSASGSTIPTPSASADPEAPASSSSGLTSREKIGIGIGVPLGAVALAASVFGCCIFLRRRRKRQIEGSQPPSSPGFIPRFSFQEGRFEPEYYQHRAPLNPRFGQQNQQYGQFVEDTNWDDDEGHDPAHMSTAYHGYMMPPAAAPTPSQANNIARNSTPHSPSDVGASSPTSMLDDHRPMLAPALYHSHSSNRARGRRTSHSSLHSVAELTEPDEVTAESPILGRQHYQQQRRGSRSNGKLPALEPLSIPASASIRRKPVATSPVAETSQNTLPRPTLAAPQMAAGQHSGSSSSALALSNISSYLSSHASSFTASSHSSSFSGNRTRMGNNAGYAYLEDYGPEWYYRTATGGNGYHGYESAGSGPQERSTRSDWPLRNPDGSAGAAQKRTQSPMWDRVYDRV